MYDVAFSLPIFIIAGLFAGLYIDSLLNNSIPVFAIIFSILGLAGGILLILKKAWK